MIETYRSELISEDSDSQARLPDPHSMRDDADGPSLGDRGVPAARKFHQHLVVGLIEACKGIAELFADVATSSMSPSPSAATDTTPSPSTEAATALQAGYRSLQACLTPLMRDYTLCLTSAIRRFFDQLGRQLTLADEWEQAATLEGGGGSGHKGRQAQLLRYELDEQRQGWLLLARQAVLDCQLLDRAASDCAGPRKEEDKEKEGRGHSFHFAKAIVSQLEDYATACHGRRMQLLLRSLSAAATGEIAAACDAQSPSWPLATPSSPSTNPWADGNSQTSLSLLHPDPYAARAAVSHHTSTTQTTLQQLTDELVTCFSDLCGDLRPLLDVLVVSAEVDPSLALSSISGRCCCQHLSALKYARTVLFFFAFFFFFSFS